MPYEMYSEKRSTVSRQPFLSISAPNIRFNLAACKLLQYAAIRYVNIFWDKETNRLALSTSYEDDMGAYKLTVTQNKHAMLTCKNLLARAGIPNCAKIPVELNFDINKDYFIEVTIPSEFPLYLPVANQEHSPSILFAQRKHR